MPCHHHRLQIPKKYNNLVEDKYLQRPAHFKGFPEKVQPQNNLLHPIQKYYKTQTFLTQALLSRDYAVFTQTHRRPSSLNQITPQQPGEQNGDGEWRSGGR